MARASHPLTMMPTFLPRYLGKKATRLFSQVASQIRRSTSSALRIKAGVACSGTVPAS